jgi:hypothetical protein
LCVAPRDARAIDLGFDVATNTTDHAGAFAHDLRAKR